LNFKEREAHADVEAKSMQAPHMRFIWPKISLSAAAQPVKEAHGSLDYEMSKTKGP